jgi:AraC family transcriptional regulator
MTAPVSFEDWISQGCAPHVQERRAVTSTPIWMFDLIQPAGDFPDPPMNEMMIIQDMRNSRALCDFGAGRFKFDPGSISVVPCRSATAITADNAHNIRVLGFHPDRLNSWAEVDEARTDLGHLHATAIQSQFVHQLLHRIWNAGTVNGEATSLYSDAALLTLWADLMRQAELPLVGFARGGLASWQVRRCTEYLNENVSENVGLEKLAALVGLSSFHFARAFKQSIGMPPHRYQLGLRIAQAKALLETTDAPVTQIAFDVGYESSQALARLFRREVGLSPSDYRRRVRR